MSGRPYGQTRPAWLKVAVRAGPEYRLMVEQLNKRRLTTVCRESGCPNIWECFGRKEMTFMIMGDACTRACRYCGVSPGRPVGLDRDEPQRLAEAVAQLALDQIVITSVTRDDLEDGGAEMFVEAVAQVRRLAPNCIVELLIPDMGGVQSSIDSIIAAGADVVGHNLETVSRLFPQARRGADYKRSLDVLAYLTAAGQTTKSGLMVGLGEKRSEIREALRDLRGAGIDWTTIGQYLSPSPAHIPVDRFWRPEEFVGLARYAKGLGFSRVLSGPLVRSSYRGSRRPHQRLEPDHQASV